MTHKEIQHNSDKLAELARVVEACAQHLGEVVAESMLKRYLPRVEALANQLSFDVRSLTHENKQLHERVRIFTEEQNRRAAVAARPFI